MRAKKVSRNNRASCCRLPREIEHQRFARWTKKTICHRCIKPLDAGGTLCRKKIVHVGFGIFPKRSYLLTTDCCVCCCFGAKKKKITSPKNNLFISTIIIKTRRYHHLFVSFLQSKGFIHEQQCPISYTFFSSRRLPCLLALCYRNRHPSLFTA